MVEAMKSSARSVLAFLLLVSFVVSSVPVPLLAQEVGTTTSSDSGIVPLETSSSTPALVLPASDIGSTTPANEPEGSTFRALASLPAPAGTLILNQGDASADITFAGGIGFVENSLEPAPIYTALATGTVSTVDMYLARNTVTNSNQFYLTVYNEAGTEYICTLFYSGLNTNGFTLSNYLAIPVGDATNVALVRFDHPEGNCTLSKGTSYRMKLYHRVGGQFDEGILYTKGKDATSTFFIQAYTTDPQTNTPPVCTENCNSSVLFLPGIKASVLRSGQNKLWPPTIWTNDVNALALTASGDSVHPVQVDGILNFFYGTPVYDGFSKFMDGLVADGTIQEWMPMPYDWRFSPEKILTEGVQTPTGVVDIITEVERLAERSRTGKVTIVAHSMGGLMGKALIKKLEEKGESGLIDSFVMVGTPQLGTPQGVASLLHGDDEAIPVLVNSSDVRQVAQNMESAYNLMPSPEYFLNVADPVITFSTTSAFTLLWRNTWGTTIDTFAEFTEFITGSGVTRSDPASANLQTPEILRSDIANAAVTFHATFDKYAIPDSIHTVQIAGWGVSTLKGILYKDEHGSPSYEPKLTREGDKTVVYPSAISSTADETYFFNLFEYNDVAGNKIADHKDLLSTEPTQLLLKAVLTRQNLPLPNFITTTKPSLGDLEDQLLVSTHSPVVLGAYDSKGNFTGISSNQKPASGFRAFEEGIPGSTFLSFGGDQYLILPKSGSYTFKVLGTGSGPTTIRTKTISGDTVNPSLEFTDIPVTAQTNITFGIDSTVPEKVTVQIDQNGDGQTDTYVAPDDATLSVAELIVNLKTAINGISFTKPEQKMQLLNKLAAIEQRIAKQKEKQTKILEKLQTQIAKKAGKGKIDQATANDLNVLLDQLIGGSSLLPLNTALLQELKDKILRANISVPLKTNLLVKVARLESVVRISRSIDSMSKAVTKKGAKGVLSTAEMQNLLNLLDQIQRAI